METNWRLMVSYKVSDYPNFELDEGINEILDKNAIDGGSGCGFGYRDHDATYETKEQVMEAWHRIITEFASHNRVVDGRSTIDLNFFEAFACCGNPADDDCICE